MNAIRQLSPRTMPKMSAVKPSGKCMVEVTWSEGGRAPRIELVDLSPLINSHNFYKPLRSSEALFATVHLIDDGEVLAWGDSDALDMSATSIEWLAEDMMTAADFREWLATLNYTHNTAAAQLGYSRRQIENFLAGHTRVPRVCVLACKALQQRQFERQAQSAAVSQAPNMHESTP